MNQALHILGISGSLRQGSYNTALLRAVIELLPADMTIETADIASIPLYNEDVRSQGLPEPVQKFREQIAAADAVLIVTPEYNYSVPGGLKNAIDWASRPPEQPFNEKPLAIMGATGGNFGTVRAQMHLRHMCVFLNAFPLNKPEVLVTRAHEKIDVEGRLTDEATRKIIGDLLIALGKWTRRLRGE